MRLRHSAMRVRTRRTSIVARGFFIAAMRFGDDDVAVVFGFHRFIVET